MYFEEIVLQEKTVFENHTKKYLVPSLKIYGQSFAEMFSKLDKVAFGLGDYIAEICGSIFKEVIFILVKINPYLQYVINRLKQMNIYEYDYCFDNLLFGKYHMIVINFPSIFRGSFEQFLQGNFSKMFSKEHITALFSNEDTINIFQKNILAKINFRVKIEKTFNIILSEFETIDWKEYDFPISKKQEYFNYNLIKNE